VPRLNSPLCAGPRGWFTSVPEQVVQSAALTILNGSPPPPSRYAGHGAGGEEYSAELHRAEHSPKELWTIPEAHHTRGDQARPRQYEQRVVGFFNRALLGR
jgi:hypothetical protein